MNKTHLACLIASLLSGYTTATFAAEESKDTKDDNNPVERIIVTGTSKGRVEAETPQSVTSFGEVKLAKLTASSQADVLRYIPGIKVEGGGGEVATNLQVRGLPSAGQFQFTPLLYDGSPTLSAFGLNSSAFDVYYRNDLGIQRVEFARGGVSNLFGPGSVAGVINYISKKGTDTPEGTFQVELAEEGRLRTDFYTSGPLSDNGLYYAVSGYYRYDEGPIDTGLPTKGYQLRGNIHKEFEDGSGYLTFYGQAIDDKVQFFLPLPLNGADRSRLTGNDGSEVFSTQTVHASHLSYDTPNGRFETPIGDGVVTEGGSFSIDFHREISPDWFINAKAKYASYEHQFNLFLDGDGIVNVPETLGEYLANRNLGDLSNASFTYADSGQAVAAGDLLFANRLLDRNRPATDFSAEFSVVHNRSWGDFDHTFTLGSFVSRAEADDDNVITTYLGEFSSRPRLVNLTVNDVNGSISGVAGTNVTMVQNGLSNAGVTYSNKTTSARRSAIYFADQFENEDWVFDVGFRWEHIKGTISAEGSQVVSMSDDITIAPDIRNVKAGNGQYTYGEVSTSDVAVSAAALYKLTDNMNVYANLSRGFFFPEIRGVRFNQFGEPSSYEAEIIQQAEIGAKYWEGDFYGSAALFATNLDDRRTVDFVNDGNGGVIEKPILQSTEAYGIEFVGRYALTDEWSIDGNVTFQDHEFTQYDANPDVVGSELRRKPNIMVNTGLYYDNGEYDFSLMHSYNGKNFANDSNSVELDDFHLVRLDAGYTMEFSNDQRLRISLAVFNLLDSDGITEGSPRQGNAQSNSSAYFVGRPILPRRVTLRVRYDF